ncbi:MAG: CRISPR-associated protein Cas4 [Asgard group archaeon]
MLSSWFKSPMKPYYEEAKIPMYSVCSKYCPTGRDVFVNMVERKKGKILSLSPSMTSKTLGNY